MIGGGRGHGGAFGAGSREGVGVDAATVIDQESEGGERLADAPGLAQASAGAMRRVAAVDFGDAAEHATGRLVDHSLKDLFQHPPFAIHPNVRAD